MLCFVLSLTPYYTFSVCHCELSLELEKSENVAIINFELPRLGPKASDNISHNEKFL